MPYNADIDLHARRYLTSNKNLMGGVAFKVDIDKTFIPNVEYFVTSARLPEISVDPAQYVTPQRRAHMPGDKAEYAPLEIEFLVDEDMNNWEELHNWLLAEVIQKDEILQDGKHRDIILSIMSSHNNVTKQIRFVDCFPIQLSGLDFNLQNTDVQYLTANVTFQYSYYEIL